MQPRTSRITSIISACPLSPRRVARLVGGLLLLATLTSEACLADSAPLENAEPFVIKTIDGGPFELKVGDGPTVVCFLGTECPLARLYGPRLEAMQDEFAAQQVRFIGLMSNQQDSVEEIRRFATEHNLSFAIARDESNQLADKFRAQRTPEVYLLDAKLRVRYAGRIDDQYLPGLARAKPERHDLRQAITELLADRPITLTRTEPQGCLIGRIKHPEPDSEVTFCNQITRVLNKHCVECHRDGEIGPFALTDFDEVSGWAEMIQEVIDDGRMPPWHAAPEHGEFKNTRRMSEADKELVRQWVQAGAPYGVPEQLPKQPTYTSGWQLGRAPELVLSMSETPVQIPASGTVDYKYFVVDPGFEEDRWISSAQVIPGNPSIVHHAIVFVRPPDGERFRGLGWITAYVPGQRIPDEIPGLARFVPAGSKLVFQMHYTPNGQPQEDLTQVGLVFADESTVTDELITLVGIDQEFEIPPHAEDFAVEGKLNWFPKDGRLMGITPHMHLRGKAFSCEVERGGACQTILSVPRYDFNWQHVYQLSEPLRFDGIDSLTFKAHFNNSTSNPVNPDPSQFVTWGDQTWEEMAVVFFEVSTPRVPEDTSGEPETPSEVDPVVRQKIDAFVADFFAKFDRNNDQLVNRDETSIAFRRFAFWQFDKNGDRQLTEEEVRSVGESRFR